jgi:hypothetical protein
MFRAAPFFARVHWPRRGQGTQSFRENANLIRPRSSRLVERLSAPAGQRAVPASRSTVESVGVKVPARALRPVPTMTGAIRVIPRCAEAAMTSARIPGVHQVLARRQVPGDETVLDRGGGGDVRIGRAGGGDIGDRMREALVAGLAQMGRGAHPLRVALGAVARASGSWGECSRSEAGGSSLTPL